MRRVSNLSRRPLRYPKALSDRIAGSSPSRLLAALSVSCLYIIGVLFDVSDADVALNRKINIAPVLSLRASSHTFLFTAAMALGLLLIYYHISVFRLRLKLTNISPDRVDFGGTWLFSDLVSSHFLSMKRHSRSHGWRFEALVLGIVVYIVPLFTIFLIIFQVLLTHSYLLMAASTGALCIYIYVSTRYSGMGAIGRSIVAIVLIILALTTLFSAASAFTSILRPCYDHTISSHWRISGVLERTCQAPDANARGSVFTQFLYDNFAFYAYRSAQFSGTELMTVRSEMSQLSADAQFNGPLLWGRNLRGASFDNIIMKKANIQGSDLSGAWIWSGNISESFINRSRFTLSILSLSNMSKAHIGDSWFDGTIMSTVVLDKSILADNIFRNVDFSQAFITNSTIMKNNFDGSSFSNTSLKGSLLVGNDLSKAIDLSQNQLNEACGIMNLLPDKLTIPTCQN